MATGEHKENVVRGDREMQKTPSFECVLFQEPVALNGESFW